MSETRFLDRTTPPHIATLILIAGLSALVMVFAIMSVLGVAMVAIFMHIRFALYKRLGRFVSAGDWAAGGSVLAKIRTWVSINLGLGVLIILVTLLRGAA